MRIVAIFIMLIGLSGCQLLSGNVKTTVTWEDGSEVKVSSKSDAIVTMEKDGEKLTVDNRGRPGFIEQIVGAFLVKPDSSRSKP